MDRYTLWKATAIGIMSMLAASALFSQQPLLTRNHGRLPEDDRESRTVQGDVVYSEFDFPTHLVAMLKEPLRYKKHTYEVGVSLFAYEWREDVSLFCSRHIGQRSSLFGGGLRCLLDADSDGRFERFKVVGSSALATGKTKISPPAAYELKQQPIATGEAEDWAGDFFRKEVLYQGVAGGSLRLLYREFINDFAREAFSQELIYDYSGEPITVAVKGARLEILSAGNDGLVYRVINGF